MAVDIIQGDSRAKLRGIESDSVDCCITSPPYWRLRDYGMDAQIGLEESVDDYVFQLVRVFRDVRRVLRSFGSLWLNLGDSYIGKQCGRSGSRGLLTTRGVSKANKVPGKKVGSLSNKSLVGVPWRVAFALQNDGWILRSDIIWAKPSPMPESVSDRPTRAHEYVFLLAKSERYYFNQDEVREADSGKPSGNGFVRKERLSFGVSGNTNRWLPGKGRRVRSVWTIATQPFHEAHFAVSPPRLVERCIRAGCPPGGVVLDPFAGAGTTGLVADRLGRDAVLIELNPTYCDLARRRIHDDAPLLANIGRSR